MNLVAKRATILTVLAVVMAVTRLHHFGVIPDASWAVFFAGGFWLRHWSRVAFPVLMALAVLVDFLVIQSQGISFFQHYCVSLAYWCLIPAYYAMWAGGAWLRRHYVADNWRSAGLAVASVLASVALCHLIAQGSFYWISDSVANPTANGWWMNYGDWFLPYLRVTTMYITAAAIAQVIAEQVARSRGNLVRQG